MHFTLYRGIKSDSNGSDLKWWLTQLLVLEPSLEYGVSWIPQPGCKQLQKSLPDGIQPQKIYICIREWYRKELCYSITKTQCFCSCLPTDSGTGLIEWLDTYLPQSWLDNVQTGTESLSEGHGATHSSLGPVQSQQIYNKILTLDT